MQLLIRIINIFKAIPRYCLSLQMKKQLPPRLPTMGRKKAI